MRAVFTTFVFAALGASAPAIAADYAELRPAYPEDWHTGEDNALRFEGGLRYWYSIAEQNHSIGSDTQKIQSKSSSGEVFARVEDLAKRSFLEATGGYGITHEGSFSTNGSPTTGLLAARLGYIGADYGWLPWGNETAGVGFLAGYQYLNDSPDTGRANFLATPIVVDNGGDIYTLGGGGDSKINNFDFHLLKLGFAGKADFGGFDLQGEAAAIPYSWVSGTYGAYEVAPGFNSQQSSATTITGYGYGATGKLMVGLHPTENLTIRVGGRASYLTGAYDVKFDAASLAPNGTNPPTVATQTFTFNDNPFNMLRYGALLEVSGRF